MIAKGNIDNQLSEFKKSYDGFLQDRENETIVIVNSTEKVSDGTEKEFINICSMDNENRLSLVKQYTLSDVLDLLVNIIENGIRSEQ
jgi:hypothetical protein